MSELTPEAHHALVNACDQHAYHHQASAACNVAWSTVRGWLIRGLTSQAPEDEKYRDFAREYFFRDSELAKKTYRKLIWDEKEPGERKTGSLQPKILWDWYHKRWPVSESEASILSLIEAKETKRLAIVESLRHPNAELAECIREAGLVLAEASDAGLRDNTS